MARAFLNAPEFLAREWIIGVRRFGADANQGRFATDLSHVRCRERLAKVTLGLRLSVWTEVLEVDGTVRSPNGLARVLIERDDILATTPIEVHNQKIPVKDRRRTGGTIMITFKVPPLPKHFAGAGIEARSPWRTKRHVDSFFFHDRRR